MLWIWQNADWPDFRYDEAIKTSQIEGEILDRESVQSSIQRHFGLKPSRKSIAPAEHGISDMMFDVYKTHNASAILLQMKRVLALILMLVMLTPSLACAMPLCADSQKTAQSGYTPCAEHSTGSEETEKSGDLKDRVNLLIDCMGVDLQTADHHADIKKYDFTDVIVYATADDVLASQPDLINSKIRGPPPDWLALSDTHPPIILTTQRFRI